jgi:hypothetical protein
LTRGKLRSSGRCAELLIVEIPCRAMDFKEFYLKKAKFNQGDFFL